MPPERRGGGPPPPESQQKNDSQDRVKNREFDPEKDSVPRHEIRTKQVRGGGPGGQAINTTASRVEVRWNYVDSNALTQDQKLVLKRAAGQYGTKDGDLIFSSQEERSAGQNQRRAIENLNQFVRAALTVQPERTPTKKSRGQKTKERRKREADKRRKRGRGKVRRDDW